VGKQLPGLSVALGLFLDGMRIRDEEMGDLLYRYGDLHDAPDYVYNYFVSCLEADVCKSRIISPPVGKTELVERTLPYIVDNRDNSISFSIDDMGDGLFARSYDAIPEIVEEIMGNEDLGPLIDFIRWKVNDEYKALSAVDQYAQNSFFHKGGIKRLATILEADEYGLTEKWMNKPFEEVEHCAAIDIDDFTMLCQLGSGGSRDVYLAKSVHSPDPYVIKMYRLKDLHDKIVKHREEHGLENIFENEVQRVKRYNHPNVMRIFSSGQYGDTYFLEVPYMDGGDLSDHVGEIDEKNYWDIFRQMCAGVNYVHSKGDVIRDVKLENFRVSSDLSEVVLDDLETTREEGTELSIYSERYKAPEVVNGEEATVASDIYSLGCCLYYMFTGKKDTIEKL